MSSEVVCCYIGIFLTRSANRTDSLDFDDICALHAVPSSGIKVHRSYLVPRLKSGEWRTVVGSFILLKIPREPSDQTT